jgi:hypothetical protein
VNIRCRDFNLLWSPNNGKPAAKQHLANWLAASTLAAYVGYFICQRVYYVRLALPYRIGKESEDASERKKEAADVSI